MRLEGPNSQHIIFFVTYEWSHKARVSHYTRLERLDMDKQYSLMGPFISYDKDEVL